MNINPKQEEIKIVEFIKKTLEKTKKDKVVIGLSGGIDSAASLYLLKKTLPLENIIVAHLYYFEPENLESLLKDVPKDNLKIISIKDPVDKIIEILNQVQAIGSEASGSRDDNKKKEIRVGNIIARARMVFLYDLAKKYNALVCGTENKSEYYLGYFTRFGDEASDFEPIRHLYKTQVIELAKYLNVPKEFIEKTPTAGLWKNQTDEKELGFSYQEADQVLYLYFEKKEPVEQILKKGFKNVQKIIKRVLNNEFKHKTPYSLGS